MYKYRMSYINSKCQGEFKQYIRINFAPTVLLCGINSTIQAS